MAISEDPQYRKLMEAALRALSQRAHTVHEMKTKLIKKSSPDEAQIPVVLDRLKELAYLNDEEYVTRTLTNELVFRHKSLWKSMQKLQKKGINSRMVKEKWNELNLDERESAMEALQKISPKYAQLPLHEQRMKLASALLRRGYSPDLVYQLAKIQEIQ
jgi:SOS response regulatory protein OraA/RecX